MIEWTLTLKPITQLRMAKRQGLSSDAYTIYIQIAFALIFKKNLHMNVAKVDFYFIEFSAMIVKKFNEKNIFHLT